MVAEKDGEPVGMAITVPDVNQVLKRMNGRLLPLGWWKFLRKGRIIDRVRVGFLGVKPEYQHTGAAAQFYVEHFDMATQTPPDLGRDGLDPGDQPRHEPGDGGDGGPNRQAIPCLRSEVLMEAAAVSAHRVSSSTAEGVWLRSRSWDLSFLILSAALVPIPLLMYHGLGISQTAVNLIVAGLVGGPHLYTTFTYTFMEPSYRRRHRRFLAASMALPVIVTVMAFVNLQVLLTIFFTWASIHVLHQITYINDAYEAKRSGRGVVVRSLRDKIIDYGVVFTCLYPMATPQILNGEFQLGGTALYVPGWASEGLIADAQIFAAFALFGIFFVLWVGKALRDWRAGRLLVPSVLLISLTIGIGFTLPLFPNLDVAFQGFNMWHSLQYLALIWFLNGMRKERGELDNHFVAERNGPDRPLQFYGLAVALTVVAGALVLVIHGVFGVDLQKAYYIVILSTLLQHYYLDHLQFTKLGDMLGTGDRLLSGRSSP